MINETRIRCFLTLAETHSFTETAKLLYMTQQGVSKHIAHIEEEIGFPLFVRTHRTVNLTEEGKRCYEIFFEFFKQYDDFVRDVRSERDQQIKTLRVGYQNWLDLGTAPNAALEALHVDMPELELIGERYSPGSLRQKLLVDELDMILISDRFAPKAVGVRSIELRSSVMMLLVAKNHPANHPGATYQSFSKELFLIDAFESESPTSSVLRAHQELHRYGLSAEKVLVLPNRDSVYSSVELGQGVTVGSSMTQILSRGTIQAYPTQTPDTLLCIWRTGEKGRIAERYARLLQQEYQK